MATANTTTTVIHQNPPPLDEDELEFRSRIENTRNLSMILYDVNVALGVVLGILGVLLFLTILNKKLRSTSPIWYYYHLIAMCSIVALVIHTLFHSAIYVHYKELCFFLIYSVEYIFFAVGINIILLNIEIYFTTVLPLQKWQWNPFFRFVTSVMTSWTVTGIMVCYIIVNNNDGRKYEYSCFHLKDKSIRTARNILQTTMPASLCFLFTFVFIGTHCLKRSRFTFTSASGQLREVKVTPNDGEVQWMLVAVYVNFIYVVRCILDLVLTYSKMRYIFDTLPTFMVIAMARSCTLYLFPLGLFFVRDARAALKAMLFKGLALVSCGKVRLGEDLEQLAVSFGQESGTTTVR